MTDAEAVPSRMWPKAAQSASSITELLDVMWERARNATASMTAPSSTSQLRLMYVVDREDGIRMRTVCRRLASAPPTVTRMCDRLQAIGFLERMPYPDNRREVALRLTTTGKRHLQHIRVQRDSMLHQAIDHMPPAQRRALARGLAGLRTQLDTAHGEEHERPGAHVTA